MGGGYSPVEHISRYFAHRNAASSPKTCKICQAAGKQLSFLSGKHYFNSLVPKFSSMSSERQLSYKIFHELSIQYVDRIVYSTKRI